MRTAFSAILLCIAALTVVRAQDVQPAKKSDTVQNPADTSIVTGRVTYEDSGLPATRHRVQLIASEALDRRPRQLALPTTITNEDGEFTLRRLAAGEYYIFAQPIDDHSGASQRLPFLRQSGNSSADDERLKQFKKDHTKILFDGGHNLSINLRVPNPHFGTISGRVVDGTGKPAVRSFVHVLSRAQEPFGASILTDAQGNYKFWGLPAGDYILSANPPGKERANDEPIRRYEGLLGATYFPSTVDPRSSPSVAVFADRDTNDIDIRLVARSLYSVAGTVRMRGDNHPVTNATIRLRKTEGSQQPSDTSKRPDFESTMAYFYTSTDKNGHWAIENVPEGAYRLAVQSALNAPTAETFVQEERDITVVGTDIEDLSAEVSKGGRVSGVVSIEGNGTSPKYIIVDAARANGNANSHVRLEEAGKFLLTAVPSGEVRLNAFPLPRDKFYVKSISGNGLDLLRTNLTVGEGEEINNVSIVISPDVGVVTGRVLSRTSDEPIARINVMLRRVNDDNVRLIGGELAGVTDDRGNFRLSAPPGIYVVLAWRAAGGPTFRDAMDRALSEQKPGLTLAPGDQKQLDIRLP